jgi:hypothetical protein
MQRAVETVALIAALVFGLLGFTALIGISLYSTWRIDRDARRQLPHARLLSLIYLTIALGAVGAFGLAGEGFVAVPALFAVVALSLGIGASARRLYRRRRARTIAERTGAEG